MLEARDREVRAAALREAWLEISRLYGEPSMGAVWLRNAAERGG